MTGSTSESLAGIQEQITSGRFDDALAAARRILEDQPRHADALYMVAVACRFLGRPQEATEALDQLDAVHPGNGRSFQERGHLLRAQGDFEAALTAYANACQLNPALEASFEARLELLTHLGRHQQAAVVRSQLAQLKRLPRPLLAVTDLIAQGRLVKAEDLCRRFLQKVPDSVQGMRLLADIGSRLGVLDDAEFLLESARMIAPDDALVAMDYVQVLRKRQRFEQALAEADQLLARDPANVQYQSLYAIVCMQTGDYDQALEHFDRVLEKVPDDPATQTSRGHAFKTRGDFDAAVAAYRRAYENRPSHGEAYYSLSNLKTYRFEDPELERMHAQESSPELTHGDRIFLSFALGKAYEDRGDHERSFHYYREGNALKKAESNYDADRMSEDLASQRDACTSDLFERRAATGHSSPDPIFIVGLPRAGSTLLEQILSSHSQVDGTLELPNILALSQKLRHRGRGKDTRPYPHLLADLTDEEFERFGRDFIEDTRIHRAGAPFFIDKMPNNFRHIGLIHLMLPNAKIIDARRHPMACCFSAYKQLFAEGQEFSYDLADVGSYYRDYVDLMDHWDEVLPGRVLRVMHEDVVDDLEGQVRRLLDFCGLPFDENCLRYWETERNVRTPSSEQVRRPIFRESVEQWRHYEPWLGPLKEALGPALERYPIE